MAAFEYSALDSQGKTRKGVIESDSARGARSLLRDQGLAPLTIEAVVADQSTAGGMQGWMSRFQSLNPTELALFTRQISTLIAAGLPIDAALSGIIRQTENPRIRRIVTAVRSKVVEGHSLAQGLATFPRAFSELYRATVAAGEESGHLEAVLERLADYTEGRQATTQKVQMALFYPALLTLMAVAVVIGLVTYVVPQVVQVFVQMKQTLPPLTRGLIAVSAFLREQWPWILLGMAAFAIWFYWALRQPKFAFRWAQIQLKLPLIGRLIRGFNAARFARTLSILSAAGVPMLKALTISGEVVASEPMRRAIKEATDRVREGAPIARSLEQSRLFPPMMLQLIAAGEQSGALGNMLERAAVQQERELDTLINALLGLFEPILILVMGGVVLLIVLAILIPIFDLNQMVH
ncbi:MAG: type II secretion system protein GspF [Halothiobacillus sp. 14-55-98]|jgi:general secretion pathway protein F|nr:MAG: type II secretion system protein GspF [Halothiobacillus sp. 14-55-98]